MYVKQRECGPYGRANYTQGAGESLRGTLNATVDRAFGSEEGAARNVDIATKGEQEFGRSSGRS